MSSFFLLNYEFGLEAVYFTERDFFYDGVYIYYFYDAFGTIVYTFEG